MGVYQGGNTGSGNTHNPQIISGGGKPPGGQKRSGIVSPIKKATKAKATPKKRTGR